MSVYVASSAGKNGEGSFYVVINPLAFEGIYRPIAQEAHPSAISPSERA
jgi:hypothetical protein